MFKMDNRQGPPVQHRGLCSIFCNNPKGKSIWKRTDTCITESLCCILETNRTLLIKYALMYNTKLKRKKEKPCILTLSTLIAKPQVCLIYQLWSSHGSVHQEWRWESLTLSMHKNGEDSHPQCCPFEVQGLIQCLIYCKDSENTALGDMWMDVWVDRWMDGWMNEWTQQQFGANDL